MMVKIQSEEQRIVLEDKAEETSKSIECVNKLS